MLRETKVIDRESEIVFTNFTDETFFGKWNKKIYELKPGKSYYLPFYLAEVFGKHLVGRELGNRAAVAIKEARKADPRIDRKELDAIEQSIIANLNLRQELMDKCIERQDPEMSQTGIVRPREVQKTERVLKTEERSAELVRNKLVPEDQLVYNKPKTAQSEPAAIAESSFEGLE